MNNALDFADIRRMLPHRFPVALIDSVLEIQTGESLVAVKCVTANEPCFEHLPDGLPHARCTYPQSLLIESFLQAAGLLIMHARGMKDAPSDAVVLFGSLANCSFPGDAWPGDRIAHHVRVDRAFSDSAMLSGESKVGDRTIAVFGQAMVAIRPRERLQPDT